jgi:hypothetical protein
MYKKYILYLWVLSSVVYANKLYYKPFGYYYTPNPYAIREDDLIYTMDQISTNNSIKEIMGECLTRFERNGVIEEECIPTLNTLHYYTTEPKGSLRRDILEYYHDIPLSEYEKSLPKSNLSIGD